MAFPATSPERDRFVLAARPAKALHDPWRARELIFERERAADGTIVSSTAIVLTGRECPWRCVMCDLWQHTIDTDTPAGAIPAQIRAALPARTAVSGDTAAGCSTATGAHTLKLYNAGSFFDPRAVPPADYPEIVLALDRFSTVVVESHPALVGARTAQLRQVLAAHSGAALEVAMGLETIHPVALDRLNKRMSLDDFAAAAGRLHAGRVALRVFLLISPPFIPADEQDEWLVKSIDFALSCGASVISLIPTRPGNGALEALALEGAFTAPVLSDVERGLSLGLERTRSSHARVFADLWDLDRFSSCGACVDARRRRLDAMNLTQAHHGPVVCASCGGTGS